MAESTAKRIDIPDAVALSVLVANRHACCVCQKFYVQLHHIDSNPANNDPANLAVLCQDHHNLATMTAGLTKKLPPNEVKHFKAEWEAKCAADVQALARDRLRFYATVYKNPPRIRELLLSLSAQERGEAVTQLQNQIAEDNAAVTADKGFQWQATPQQDDFTLRCLGSIKRGELWPEWLPRVKGHPLDPDLATDLGPPHGMRAYHGFDLYCQLIVRILAIARGTVALEDLIKIADPNPIASMAGSLVTFRGRAIGKDIHSPRNWEKHPLGRVQLRFKTGGQVVRVFMDIKTMYVFSDTAVRDLEHGRISGIGVVTDAKIERKDGKDELHINVKPLIVGIGALGQADENGWWKS